MSQSYAKSPAAERKFTTREMVLVGMFAAVLAVISQISLPMPTGVPITIQVFGVALVGAVLGSRLGTTATLVYVLLGAIGLPIFANFSGGISMARFVLPQADGNAAQIYLISPCGFSRPRMSICSAIQPSFFA